MLTSGRRPLHKHHVKWPKYLSGNSQYSLEISLYLVVFSLNIRYFFKKLTEFESHRQKCSKLLAVVKVVKEKDLGALMQSFRHFGRLRL